MIKTYKQEDFDALYRAEKEYWKADDYLEKDYVTMLAKYSERIDPEWWNEIEDLFSVCVKKNLSKQTTKQVLLLFGYECES